MLVSAKIGVELVGAGVRDFKSNYKVGGLS